MYMYSFAKSVYALNVKCNNKRTFRYGVVYYVMKYIGGC